MVPRFLSFAVLVSLASAPLPALAQDFKAYQNYDFVPGDRIVFEDDFRSDTDGEFPAHWTLAAGQGVVNTFQNEHAMVLTEGNYVRVSPRVKGDAYLADTFTIEVDYFPKGGSFEKIIVFLNPDQDEKRIAIGHDVTVEGFEHDLTATYPGKSEDFIDKWHHAAIVYKNGQMKVYEDQYRVLVMPDAGGAAFKPKFAGFGGVADASNPLIFKNVRIATGGGMNLIDKLTKDGRIVTHGILFDVNQSTIKPQSAGAIAQIVKLLQDNPALKLEIGGHTDSDGDAAKNLTLSQARADAVKSVLLDRGIDAARLTTKGYGATQPLDPSPTPEGKANNRRVEFTKTT